MVIVCDATCLERNLNLVLQILEATDRTLVCVNLLDEAEKKNITIDLDQLSDLLCVPVAGTSARKKSTLSSFLERLDDITEGPAIPHYQVTYCPELEKAVSMVEPAVKNWLDTHELPFYTTSRFLSLRLLEDDPSFLRSFTNACQLVPSQDPAIADCLKTAWDHLNRKGIFKDILKDRIVSGLIDNAETIASLCVKLPERSYNETDRKLDRILTGRLAAYPAMAGLLALIFWITLVGANDLSALLSRLFFPFSRYWIRPFYPFIFQTGSGTPSFMGSIRSSPGWFPLCCLPWLFSFLFYLIGGLRLSAPYRLQLRPAFPVL